MVKKKKKGNHASGLIRRVATVNGERKEFYGESATIAEAKRDEWIRQRSQPNYKDITLAEWLKEWMDKIKAGNIDASSLKRHEQNTRIHIAPSEIGKMHLGEILPQNIVNFMTSKRKSVVCHKKNPTPEYLAKAKPISQRTLSYIYITLNAAMESARRLEIIPRNPCEAVDKPEVKRKLPQPLKKDEQTKYLTTIARHPLLYPISILALDSGCRSGELLRLTWENVFLSSGYIRIAKGKTDNAPRKIPIPARSVKLLEAHKEAQAKYKKSYGMRYIDNKLVFADAQGKPIPNYTISKMFKRAALKAGLHAGVKFHNLRDTHATELLELGEHPFNVQERLGHATLQMTKDYSKVTSQHHDTMIEKLNKNRESGTKVVKRQRIIKKISLRDKPKSRNL